jgi:stage V sporulation protein B
MGFATYFLQFGLEYACALATIGMAFGEMSNLLVLTVFYRHKKYKHLQVTSKKGILRKRVLLKRVLACAVPVSINRFIISIMMAIEVILIPQRLLAGGLNAIECMQEYGKLTGMAMPLIFFPALVTTSISTTLVPAISESLSVNDFGRVNYRISKSIQITMVLGFLFTAMFACYSNQIAELIYPNQAVGHTLFLLSFTCVLVYLTQIMMGIMNGLGKQGVLLLNSVIGATIRILCVIFLIPKFGIPSYVAGIIVSSIIVCMLNFATINKNTGIMMDLRKWIILPGIVTTFLIFTGKYIYSFFNFLKLATPLHTLFVIIIFMFAGLGLMTIVGVIDRKEVMQLVGLKKARGRR